jgi:hypothetical protein
MSMKAARRMRAPERIALASPRHRFSGRILAGHYCS